MIRYSGIIMSAVTDWHKSGKKKTDPEPKRMFKKKHSESLVALEQ